MAFTNLDWRNRVPYAHNSFSLFQFIVSLCLCLFNKNEEYLEESKRDRI